jgi:Tol biopolymer transport system component
MRLPRTTPPRNAICFHAFATASIVLLALPARGQEAVEPQFLSNVRQVTSGFVRAGEGYFSPDGRTIVFQAVRKGYPFYQIFTLPLAADGDDGRPADRAAEPLRISTGRGRTTCSYFSPDGERILFASSHLDPGLTETEEEALRQEEDDRRTGRRRRYEWVFDPHMDLFVADREGAILQRLTDSSGYDAEGAYSPDGKQIVFCSTRDGDPDLYVLQSDGSGVRQITDKPGYDGGPFFSPDGRWIVYRTDREEPDRLQIHVIRPDGSGDLAITSNPNEVNWAPYWHPTEPYLIWCGADHSDPTRRPNYDLWLVRYTIENDRFVPGPMWRVTDHDSADVLPVFSPDGTRLMWTAGRSEDASSQLWIADFHLPESDAANPQ